MVGFNVDGDKRERKGEIRDAVGQGRLIGLPEGEKANVFVELREADLGKTQEVCYQ